MHHDKILILDFGSQTTQLIARRVREARVYSVVQPYDIDPNWISSFVKEKQCKGIILSGGPNSIIDKYAPDISDSILDLQVPILGICYGMQILASKFGGSILSSSQSSKKFGEFGYAEATVLKETILLKDIYDFFTENKEPVLKVWMSHADLVTKLPIGFQVTASTNACSIAAMENKEKNFYGMQFHPESIHTLQGRVILERFVYQICQCHPNWIIEQHVTEIIKKIRDQVKKDNVILGLSGGVDSTVTAILLQKAIKNQLTCVFVNHGLLRLHESRVIIDILSKLDIKVIYIDAVSQFLEKISGISDPEEKRKIIGKEFIRVFENEAKKNKNNKWLAQGTIYPDIIESSNIIGQSNPIKSHHNVAGIPHNMCLKLLEPLKALFKDEVQKIGLSLGLSPKIVYQHPFPGPGLGIRILGEVKEEYINLLRLADAIFIEELHRNVEKNTGKSWYELTSQAFAVFLPIKSVGVMGDKRTYEHTILLRAIQTQDFMTANWMHLPYELLNHISNRIINEVPGINRVVYDISSKPPATIELE